MADITTPMTEVETTVAQTAAKAKVGEDKGKERKLMFSKGTNHLLFQAFRQHREHHAPDGKNYDAFDQVHETVIKSFSTYFWSRYQKQTKKTVKDKIRFMLVDWRGANLRNINSSGIEEIFGPVKQLLDEFISEVDHCEEENCREK